MYGPVCTVVWEGEAVRLFPIPIGLCMSEHPWICPQCGESNPPSTKNCRNCYVVEPAAIRDIPSEIPVSNDAAFVPRWLTYFIVIFIWGCSGFFSLAMAMLSINMIVIHIFLWTAIVFLIFAVRMISKKVWLAYLLAVAHVPAAFLLAFLYYYIWGTP